MCELLVGLNLGSGWDQRRNKVNYHVCESSYFNSCFYVFYLNKANKANTASLV